MSLSKETLNKTVSLLQEEIRVIEGKEKEVLNDIRQHSVGNFNVNYVDKRWLGSKDEQEYEVNFRYKEREADLDFRIFSNGEIDRLSWGSWSFSKVTKEEIQKSIAYIDAVKEMLTIVSDTSVAQPTIDAVIILYAEELNPLSNKRYELEREVSKIQKEIEAIEKEEKLIKALELFSNTVYFNNPYQVARHNYARSVKIEQKKDKYFAIMDENRKKIDIQTIVWLYDWAHKIVRSYEYSENEEDRYNKTYYKNDNMFLTREEAIKPVKTEITEEEWRELGRE
jgi:FtsZ-binding cell division protein ZapB